MTSGHTLALNYLVAVYQLMASPQKLNLLMSIWEGGGRGQGEGGKYRGVWPTPFHLASCGSRY